MKIGFLCKTFHIFICSNSFSFLSPFKQQCCESEFLYLFIFCIFLLTRNLLLCRNAILQQVVTLISEWQLYYSSMTNLKYLYFWRWFLQFFLLPQFRIVNLLLCSVCLFLGEINCALIAFGFVLLSGEQLLDGLLPSKETMCAPFFETFKI